MAAGAKFWADAVSAISGFAYGRILSSVPALLADQTTPEVLPVAARTHDNIFHDDGMDSRGGDKMVGSVAGRKCTSRL